MSQIFSPATNRLITERRNYSHGRYLSNNETNEDRDEDQDDQPSQDGQHERSRAQDEAIAQVMTRSQWKIKSGSQNLRADLSKICSICLAEASGVTGDRELIRPCLCTGKRSYQHKCCVQGWIEQTGVVDCPFCGVRYEFTRMPKGPLSYVQECGLQHDIMIHLGACLFALYLFIVGQSICYNFVFAIYQCSSDSALSKLIESEQFPDNPAEHITNWQDLETLVDCRRSVTQLEQAHSWLSIALFCFACVGTILLFIGMVSICLNTIFKQYIRYQLWRKTNFTVSVRSYASGWSLGEAQVSGLQVNHRITDGPAGATSNGACT